MKRPTVRVVQKRSNPVVTVRQQAVPPKPRSVQVEVPTIDRSSPGLYSDVANLVVKYHCLKEPMVEIPALLKITSMTPARKILEIGTFQGASSAALGLVYPQAEILTVDLYDPTEANYNPQSAENRGIAFRSMGVANVRQILCNSRELSSWIARPERFDLIFVDGDHSEEGCYIDLCNSVNILSPEGVIVGHDYTDETDESRPKWTLAVYRAVSRFLAERPSWKSYRLPGWLVLLTDTIEKLHTEDCMNKSVSPMTCGCR